MAESGNVSYREFNETRETFRKDINKNTNDIIRLEAMFTSFKDLPNTIQNLDKTIALMGENLKELNKRFDKFEQNSENINNEQNKKISNIDNKGKIDIIEIIKKHWFEAVIAGYIIFQLISEYMPR